ncbi:unnamed protein product [Lactuca saligna]|uniref:HMA domain-containing protein n=1 Tax=Lactuca saligna TaxID=75948 RepID=A0AA36E199_LACSI|nr:unnamed protein product [Lactuca saligna]
MTTVEMIVDMDCHGCERKVRKALQNLDGVDNIDIDMDLQKVTVTGWVDQEKVLRKVRKTGKKAELWTNPYNPEAIGFTQQYGDMYTQHSDRSSNYYQDVEQPDISTLNYYGSGYYGNREVTYQQLPYSSSDIGERASIAFSDENVNACSIM